MRDFVIDLSKKVDLPDFSLHLQRDLNGLYDILDIDRLEYQPRLFIELLLSKIKDIVQQHQKILRVLQRRKKILLLNFVGDLPDVFDYQVQKDDDGVQRGS